MDPVPGRIQDDGVRLLLDGVQDLEDVPGDELAVGQAVPGRVDLRRLHGLLHDLDADDFLRCGGHELGDGPGPAVKIVDDALPAALRLLILQQIAAGGLIEDLRAVAVGLEEGKGRHLKLQAQQLLREMVGPVQDLRPLIGDDVRQGIIVCVQNAGVPTLQAALFLQVQKRLAESGQVRCHLCRRDQVHQDLAGEGRLADQEMAQISRVAEPVVKGKEAIASLGAPLFCAGLAAGLRGQGRKSCLPEILQRCPQDQGKIRIGDPAAVDGHDVVEAAPAVHAQGQGAVLVFVPEGEFHLVAVGVFLRTGQDPLKPSGDIQFLCRQAGQLRGLLHGRLQKPADLAAFELQLLLEGEIEIHAAAAAAEVGAGGGSLPGCLFQDLHQGPLRFSAALFGHAQTDPLPRQDIFDDADALRCLHDSLARVIDPGYITFQYVVFFH